jgi:hypothetical protein
MNEKHVSSGRGAPASPTPLGLILAVIGIQFAHWVYFDPFVGTYGDTVNYVHLAGIIFSWPVFATYYQPLFPAFLKACMVVADPDHFRRFATFLQIVMVVVTCLLVYRIVFWLTARRWLAGLAALLLALDVRVTIYEYLLLTEILSIFLSMVFVYAAFRLFQDSRWLWAVLAALSLLGAALTKFSFVPIVFLGAGLSALGAWRFRQAAFALPLRRGAVTLAAAVLLLTAKLATCYHYTGAISAHSGDVLMGFVSLEPRMVTQLPDGDPEVARVKAFYATNGNLLGGTRQFITPEDPGGSARVASKIYWMAVPRHPILATLAAMKEYYWENTQNYLYCYPEETNGLVFITSPNPLFAVERGLNSLFFAPWRNLVWSSLGLLFAVLAALSRLPAPKRLLLGLLLVVSLDTLLTSTLMWGGFYTPDNTRMHLMYEAPLIVFWVFVPCWLVERRRRHAEPAVAKSSRKERAGSVSAARGRG